MRQGYLKVLLWKSTTRSGLLAFKYEVSCGEGTLQKVIALLSS